MSARVLPNERLPYGREVDDDDLPFADEIPGDEDLTLPLASELTETEAAIYGGATIHAASSWIEEFKYFGADQQLYVLTKGSRKSRYAGKIYRLDGVGFRTAMDFYKSDSPGRYFNRFLKGRYPGAKLGSMPTSRGPNVVMTVD